MKKIVTVAGLASVLAFGGFFTALQTVEAKSCKKWDLACKAKAAADKAKTAAKKAAKKAKAAADKVGGVLLFYEAVIILLVGP